MTIDGQHIPRHRVIEHLADFGLWPLESDDMLPGLNQMTNDELAERFRFVCRSDNE